MALIGNDIHQAARYLQSAVIGIPTETVYGLAGNALETQRVAQIFEVKQRPFFDPLILHVGRLEAVFPLITDFPEPLLKLAESFWPGPLTLLLPRNNLVPDLTCSGLSEAAFRIPSHPLTLELLNRLDFPLAAPSANPFGYVSPTTAQHVNDQLGDKIPYILDGGPCAVGLESTIVGLEGRQITVFRLGGLAISSIEAVVGPVQLRVNQSSDPRAPGMLKSHYAPRKPLLLGNTETLLREHQQHQPLLIRFQELLPGYPEELQLLLSHGSMSEAAANLFAILRRADQHPASLILAETAPNHGLGLAINDRLQRASTDNPFIL